MSKINTKVKQIQNRVNEAKTVENIKYEPLVSPLISFIGTYNKKIKFAKWATIPQCGQNLIF